ncbi:MAG: threonine ammonia-lyase [Anaerolinea sp.]|nr:threonine ammonia-lyase [Anaerolinea sp.]
MIPTQWMEQAAERIAPYLLKTPVTYDPGLDIHFKWESKQVTGSFKARGALNKVLSLQEWERKPGLVAASAGNHGQGVALAADITGCNAVIYLPETASKIKVEAIVKAGAQVEFVASGYEQAEKAAQVCSQETGRVWISPYNDLQVICGQAVIGLELMEQLDMREIRLVIVPIGGGGLIAGIGAAIKEKHPDIRLIGVQAETSPYFHSLFTRHTQDGVIESPGLADGLEGRVEDDSLTIPLVNRLVDDILVVSEEDIKRAMRYAWMHYGEIIEGSAAVGLAARLNGKMEAAPAVIIISGGNIVKELHQSIVLNS